MTQLKYADVLNVLNADTDNERKNGGFHSGAATGASDWCGRTNMV